MADVNVKQACEFVNQFRREYTFQVRHNVFCKVAVQKNNLVSSLLTVFALAFVIGAANRNFENISDYKFIHI